ncbi:MAG: hypothetical protein ACK51V_02575 [bacterium]|jgi:hypothetical protein
MKLISPVQHAVIDNFTGIALALHGTKTEAELSIPRKPPYDDHPGFRVARVLVTIEELAPIPPVQQLYLPYAASADKEATHVAHQ